MQKNKKQFFALPLVSNDPIVKVFKDNFGREGITPRHESAIQIRLEENYTPSQVKTRLNNLEKSGFLVSRKKMIKGV